MLNFTFIDFDNTIYNCNELEKSMWGVIKRYNIKQEDYENTYRLSLHSVDPDKYDYNFEEHLSLLKKIGYRLPWDKINKELESVLEGGRNYLLEGSEILLSFLRGNSKRFILLTSGDKMFQRRKIEATGIRDYFSEIVVVDGYKEKYLETKRLTGENCLFINDNLKENIKIKRAFPKMEIVIKFDDRRYNEQTVRKSHIPYFKNLIDIKNYVEQKIR